MSTTLIFKKADYLNSGFFNEDSIEWVVEYNLPNKADNYVASPLGSVGTYDLPYFPTTSNKKIRFIKIRYYSSRQNVPFPQHLNFYNIDLSTNKAIKVCSTFNYAITGSGAKSYMLIDLGEEILFTDGVGILGFNSTFNEPAKIICGMSTNIDGYSDPVVKWCQELSGSLDEISFNSTTYGTAKWVPDIKFGV